MMGNKERENEGMQELVCDTRWSMTCTDGTLTGLMMVSSRVRQKHSKNLIIDMISF